MRADKQLLEDLVEALEGHIGVTEGFPGCFSVYAEPDPVYCPLDRTLYEILEALYHWCERWLEDPQHDALRARGDRKWHVVCGLQHYLIACKSYLKAEK